MRATAAMGALSLGTVAVGTAGATPNGRTGGRALAFTDEFQIGVPFTVTGAGGTFEVPASCHASGSEPKEYRDYTIEYDDASTSLIGVYASKKNVGVGSRYVFVAGQPCKDWPLPTDVTSAVFKPVG